MARDRNELGLKVKRNTGCDGIVLKTRIKEIMTLNGFLSNQKGVER